MTVQSRQARVVRIIGRLNIGGPALHVLNLGVRLDPGRFQQTLVVGSERSDEGSLLAQIRSKGIDPIIIPQIVTELVPHPRDVVALFKLCWIIRHVKPHIVHTHTAKAGFLGRVAAWLCGVPIIIHTFHGHVLRGYFGPIATELLRRLEQWLGKASHRLVTVSPELKADLVVLGVAPDSKVTVIPLGLELEPFLQSQAHRGQLRRELDLADREHLVGIVGRIVPIKNHELFLQATARVLQQLPHCRIIVVGDGPLRNAAEEHARTLAIADRVHFLGWRFDLPRVYADLNVLVLSSDNEGTPVAVIEAMAAGCPVVATRVGGLPDIVADGQTGLLVEPRNAEALAAAVVRILTEPEFARRLADAARPLARQRFGAERLARDMEALYEELLAEKEDATVAPRGAR